MDWWSLFRKIRRVIFALIALASLIWAIVLSYYLSKEWNYLTVLQRSIVLALICVNGVTSLLLYLMIVVVFRMWMELLRVIFLLAIHIGTAVPFTLLGARFSCKIFDTQVTCKIVDLAFLTTAWTITGLLTGYTLYLCIMSRVPRPFPLITPNDLLTGNTPSLSRTPSISSVNSKTGLLTRSLIRPTSPVSVYSNRSQQSVSSRTVPKRMFVVNNGPYSQAGDALARMRHEQQTCRGGSYGAMGSPGGPPTNEPPMLHSRFSGSTIASTRSLEMPLKAVSARQYSIQPPLSRQTSNTTTTTVAPESLRREQTAMRAPPRSLLLNPNPFTEPLSRHGTPETALSTLSFSSAPANLNLGHVAAYNPFSQTYGNYLTPYAGLPAGIPPPPQPGPSHAEARPSNPSSVGGMHAGSTILPYMIGANVSYSGAPLVPSRLHTATPSSASIHSLVPSLHCADEYSQPIPRGFAHPDPRKTTTDPTFPGLYFHAPTDPGLGLPPLAHHRTASDPIWRPYSAGARMTGMYDDVDLPNPYSRGAEIRRYGSVPHVRSGSYGGYGGYLRYDQYAYTGGYTGMGTRVHERGIARGLAVTSDPMWREMDIRAAATP